MDGSWKKSKTCHEMRVLASNHKYRKGWPPPPASDKCTGRPFRYLDRTGVSCFSEKNLLHNFRLYSTVVVVFSRFHGNNCTCSTKLCSCFRLFHLQFIFYQSRRLEVHKSRGAKLCVAVDRFTMYYLIDRSRRPCGIFILCYKW